jgi:tetratricopeptide (TPR) repeat protein
MRILYGEAGHEILGKFLKDRNPKVLVKAIHYLEEYPNPNFNDLLLRIHENQTGAIAGRCALILSRFKDDRWFPSSARRMGAKEVDFDEMSWTIHALGELASQDAKESLKKTLLELSEEANPLLIHDVIHALLKAEDEFFTPLKAYKTFYRKWAMEILHPFTEICGSRYSLEDLKMEEKKRRWFGSKNLPPAVEGALAYMENAGFHSAAKDLRRAFSQQAYRRAVEITWHSAEKIISEKGMKGDEGPFLKALNPPETNYRVLKVFREFMDDGPQDSLPPISLAGVVILSSLIEYRNLLGLRVEEKDAQILISILFEDRNSLKEDRVMMERILAEMVPSAISDHCLHQLKKFPDSHGSERALRLLGKLRDPKAIPFLVDFFKGKENTDLHDECIQALVQIGSPLVEYLEENFGRLDQNQLSDVLFALKDIPEEKTAGFLLTRWDTLWPIAKEPFLHAVEGVASQKFIDPLRKEMREGEAWEEEAFYLLCHLHGIDDPVLSQIERDMAEREKESEKRLDAFLEDPAELLRQDTINVELKCLRCGKSYHYEVEKISIISGGKETRIMDRIVCKNCRAINQYEITPRGQLTINSHLMLTLALAEKGQLKSQRGPIFLAEAGLEDGRRMTFEEALDHYQKEIRKGPKDPALRVGYGNLLINMGREEEAVRQYEEALRLDPMAVEAYACLGQFEADKGNPSGAYEYFKKAAEKMHTGHYYRSKDPDQVKEAIIENLADFEEVLGKSKEPVALPPSQGMLKSEKIGRNAPCPCGSGKKYKKCCLNRDEAGKGPKSSITPQERELRDQLLSFSRMEKYQEDFKKAYATFWRKPFREPLGQDQKGKEDFVLFLDWFIHDFRLANGATLIEDFRRDRKGQLPAEKNAFLQAEAASYFSLYEVVSVTAEVGLRVKDLLTGEEIDTLEVRGSRAAVKWDVIFARIIRSGMAGKFSGAISLVSRGEKDEILSSVRREWKKFKEETGRTEWPHFAKANGHVIYHLIEDQPRVEPIFLTEEHHRVVSAKAVFEVKNFDSVYRRLNKEFDFTVDEEGEKKVQWTWLKRGESKNWDSAELPGQHSVVLKSEMVREKGELKWTSLGNVTLTPQRLELWCISKERLERGKKRLEEVLEDYIRHQRDSYEDLAKTAKEKAGRTFTREDRDVSEKDLHYLSRAMEDFVSQWIDQKIPALGGKNPREAVQTPEGKERVLELLKDWENMEERKRKDGEPYIDVDVLRRKLNL